MRGCFKVSVPANLFGSRICSKWSSMKCALLMTSLKTHRLSLHMHNCLYVNITFVVGIRLSLQKGAVVHIHLSTSLIWILVLLSVSTFELLVWSQALLQHRYKCHCQLAAVVACVFDVGWPSLMTASVAALVCWVH